MPYCTLQTLIDQYGRPFLVQVTDRGEVATGEIDETAIGRAIDSAAATIDGYLKPRYVLPFTDVPALIAELALRIAVYKAHAAVAGEKVRRDYDDALKTLAQISAGTIGLDVAGVAPAASDAGQVVTNAPDRPMTAGSLRAFI